MTEACREFLYVTLLYVTLLCQVSHLQTANVFLFFPHIYYLPFVQTRFAQTVHSVAEISAVRTTESMLCLLLRHLTRS